MSVKVYKVIGKVLQNAAKTAVQNCIGCKAIKRVIQRVSGTGK